MIDLNTKLNQDSSSPRVAECPTCSHPGKPVPGQTVKAMLSESLRRVDDVVYYFCRTDFCPVVYYNNETKRIFTTEQLREQVYQKLPDSDDVKVCYCFGHTASEIRNSSVGGQRLIVDDINAGISAGQCACDLRNPQGTCCLGNVLKLVHLSEV